MSQNSQKMYNKALLKPKKILSSIELVNAISSACTRSKHIKKKDKKKDKGSNSQKGESRVSQRLIIKHNNQTQQEKQLLKDQSQSTA